MRTTRIRDVRGTLWHIPNGEIRRVGNMSQVWARTILDIDVAYGPPPFMVNSLAHATLAKIEAGSLPSIVHEGIPIATALSAQISTPDW